MNPISFYPWLLYIAGVSYCFGFVADSKIENKQNLIWTRDL